MPTITTTKTPQPGTDSIRTGQVLAITPLNVRVLGVKTAIVAERDIKLTGLCPLDHEAIVQVFRTYPGAIHTFTLGEQSFQGILQGPWTSTHRSSRVDLSFRVRIT